MASSSATSLDTLVTLKINVEGINKRFKLPLRDLGASTLPDKLRYLLAIPPTSEAVFERFSDSAASFVVLDPNDTSVYKQLYRAAKAKLKLRLKVTVTDREEMVPKSATVEDEELPTVTTEAEPPVTPAHTVMFPESSKECPLERKSFDQKSQAILEGLQRRFNDLAITAAHEDAVALNKAVQEQCPALPSGIQYGSAVHEKWFPEFASVSRDRSSVYRTPAVVESAAAATIFSVYCNNCSDAIPSMHWHCSTCDDGDFDLCSKCVTAGVVCGVPGHWLIKRFVVNGAVVNSTTETLPPKPKSSLASASKTTLVEPLETKVVVTRTCNCCVQELTEENFVTCLDCEDYDLCFACHIQNAHGHHPKHAFVPVAGATLPALVLPLLAPGRNVSHNAICDNCNKYIYGVRHKCLDCPDWDYCGECMPFAYRIHPGHRFVPVYEPLNDLTSLTQQYARKARHHGIFCDGPLCNNGTGNQTYIKGERFKCAVCHDTDFCGSCESSPDNRHNKTHPLIKFKTPVRNVSVTTIGDHVNGSPMTVMGDRQSCASKATETISTKSANAATQVQTVADLQPSEAKVEVKAVVPEHAMHEATTNISAVKVEAKELPATAVEEKLSAQFLRETVVDGSRMPVNLIFEQTFHVLNNGTTTWPAGCFVKFTGGDNMVAVDPFRPASVRDLFSAMESTKCVGEVRPGQEAGFTLSLRSPSKPGSYVSFWRLTTPDGAKFGPRLWCDIRVLEDEAPVMKDEAQVVKDELPTLEGSPKQETNSQMIFPKLEKESPCTSVHEEASAPVVPTLNNEPIDDFDEFVDEPLDDEETDDGFLTDEEYDILDASDEEYLAQQGKATRK